MEWCLFRRQRLWTLIFCVSAWSQSLLGTVPSFELWWVDPHIALPRLSHTEKMGTHRWSVGPLRSSVLNAHRDFMVDQIQIRGNQVRLGYVSAKASSPSLVVTGKGSVFKAPLTPFLSQPPKDVVVYRTGKVSFVLANIKPLVFALPKQLEIEISESGSVSILDPEKLIADLERQVISFFDASKFTQNFHYWFVGLDLVSNAVAEKAVSFYRDRLLRDMRAGVQSKLREPDLLRAIVDNLRSQLPIEATDDFLGVRLRFETWRLPPASAHKYAWRLRPANPAVGFTQDTYRAYWQHLARLPKNTVSLFVHQTAVTELTQAYLRRLYRGDSDLALPVDMARHPQYPWLSFGMREAERRGVALYFMDYISGLKLFSDHSLSVIAEGAFAPELVFWKHSGSETGANLNLDLRGTFVVTEPPDTHHFTSVRMGLELSNDRSIKVARLEPEAGVEPVIGRTLFQVSAALKGAVFKSLLSNRLNEAVRDAQALLANLFVFRGIYLFGELPHAHLKVAGAPAEAIAIDFGMNAVQP